VVTGEPPPTASSYSLARITRLQRTVGSARAALLGRAPRLRHGAIVRYWNLPLLSEVGFAGARALHVWYGDTTLVWTGFGGTNGWDAPRDVLVEFDVERPWPATVIEPRAAALFQAAWSRLVAGNQREADSLLSEAQRAQPGRDLAFFGSMYLARAQIALLSGDLSRADSLLPSGLRLSGPSSQYWLLVASLAQQRGDRAGTVEALGRCLAIDPQNPDALRLARLLGLEPSR
jgi:hypothetical protein